MSLSIFLYLMANTFRTSLLCCLWFFARFGQSTSWDWEDKSKRQKQKKRKDCRNRKPLLSLDWMTPQHLLLPWQCIHHWSPLLFVSIYCMSDKIVWEPTSQLSSLSPLILRSIHSWSDSSKYDNGSKQNKARLDAIPSFKENAGLEEFIQVRFRTWDHGVQLVAFIFRS